MAATVRFQLFPDRNLQSPSCKEDRGRKRTGMAWVLLVWTEQMERLVACTSLARLRRRDASDVVLNSDHHLAFSLDMLHHTWLFTVLVSSGLTFVH